MSKAKTLHAETCSSSLGPVDEDEVEGPASAPALQADALCDVNACASAVSETDLSPCEASSFSGEVAAALPISQEGLLFGGGAAA